MPLSGFERQHGVEQKSGGNADRGGWVERLDDDAGGGVGGGAVGIWDQKWMCGRQE